MWGEDGGQLFNPHLLKKTRALMYKLAKLLPSYFKSSKFWGFNPVFQKLSQNTNLLLFPLNLLNITCLIQKSQSSLAPKEVGAEPWKKELPDIMTILRIQGPHQIRSMGHHVDSSVLTVTNQASLEWPKQNMKSSLLFMLPSN